MKKPGIYIMTDEEFEEMKRNENKESVLSALIEASRNDSKFTVKDMKKKETKTKSKLSDTKGDGLLFSSLDIPDRVDDDFSISDAQWDGMMSYFDEISPIDDIAGEERFNYRRHSDEDEYQAMFKKEKSMLNDVLTELQKRSKVVNSKINAMSGKGTYGVSKNFVDLVEASVSLDKTKLDTIKGLVDIKKTAADLKLKDRRLNPDTGEDDRDSVADAFYKQIMGGGNKQFLQNTLTPYSNLQGAIIGSRSNSEINDIEIDDEYRDDIGFNISQPIPQEYQQYNNQEELEADPYGYIANENKGIQICLHRFDDDTLRFVALDENGETVDDYELPDESLLTDIKIKPMSNYAYDRYERKYKIIDVQTSGVDLDDLDDDYYDTLTNDDKYDLG